MFPLCIGRWRAHENMSGYTCLFWHVFMLCIEKSPILNFCCFWRVFPCRLVVSMCNLINGAKAQPAPRRVLLFPLSLIPPTDVSLLTSAFTQQHTIHFYASKQQTVNNITCVVAPKTLGVLCTVWSDGPRTLEFTYVTKQGTGFHVIFLKKFSRA